MPGSWDAWYLWEAQFVNDPIIAKAGCGHSALIRDNQIPLFCPICWAEKQDKREREKGERRDEKEESEKK